MEEVLIPVADIQPGENYRVDFDEAYIASLWSEIETLGLLHPITVQTVAETSKFRIVAGECRWRAHVHGGSPTIRAYVRDDLSAKEADRVMMVENDGRRELNPIEQAFSYRRQIDKHGESPADIAAAIGRRTGYVRDRLALLELSPAIVGAVRTGALPHTTALKLVGLDGNRQRIALRDYMQNPSMTAEKWQARIDELRDAQYRDAQVTTDWVLQQESYTPVLESTTRQPGKVGLARLLEKVLVARDTGADWSAGLDAEVRFAVERILGEKATAQRQAAFNAWETMRKDKAG